MPDGEWSASRDVGEHGQAVASKRDSYDWRPKEKLVFVPGATFRWELGYYWPADATMQKKVPADQVAVSLMFLAEPQAGQAVASKPERSSIHLYRSTDAGKRQHPSETSLTTIMLWHLHRNGNLSGTAVLPLDHVLAFADGFDRLVWNVRSAPNETGAMPVLAKGMLPIAAMRDKIAEIPKLRKLLDKKARNFLRDCEVPRMAPVLSSTQ